ESGSTADDPCAPVRDCGSRRESCFRTSPTSVPNGGEVRQMFFRRFLGNPRETREPSPLGERAAVSPRGAGGPPPLERRVPAESVHRGAKSTYAGHHVPDRGSNRDLRSGGGPGPGHALRGGEDSHAGAGRAARGGRDLGAQRPA